MTQKTSYFDNDPKSQGHTSRHLLITFSLCCVMKNQRWDNKLLAKLSMIVPRFVTLDKQQELRQRATFNDDS
jgi:hypothetical protein